MSEKDKDYEFARKVMRNETKNPSVYTKNRQRAAFDRVYKIDGDKAAKELAREFFRK
jgi:hypothetical protein